MTKQIATTDDNVIHFVPTSKPTAESLRLLLLRNEGSVRRTAEQLGCSRMAIYNWMRGYGIHIERVPVAAPDDVA